jgi:molybdopterin-guanine dinucleotide biosynthesis protein A
MSTVELKTDLHNLIDEINDTSILKALHTLLKQKKSEVIGFSAGRKPLTKKELIKRLEKAENQIKKGQSVTIDELEEEAQSW